MADGEPIPDESLVVRCGLPPFLVRPLHKACDLHPEGVHGFSVQAGAGLVLEQLALACRNAMVGVATVGQIRALGYDVIRSSGVFHHATVVVPRGWSGNDSESLASLFRPTKNPSLRPPS